MANVYQQAAKRRKVGYLVAIAVLLVLSLVVRGTFFRVGRASADEIAADPVKSLTLDGRAKVHELTELHQGGGGEELSGAAVRLLLTGSRGLAVSALWQSAIEKQKRHECHELDIAVGLDHQAAAALHHAVDLPELEHRVQRVGRDARGSTTCTSTSPAASICWPRASGGTSGRPDMRYQIAFYYQNKFGVSDQVKTLRCLFQLRCIPDERARPGPAGEPGQIRSTASGSSSSAGTTGSWSAGSRRARHPGGTASEERQVLAATPGEVMAFLRNNRKLPSRYKPGDRELEKDRRLKQFPVLPDLAGSR